MLKLKNNLVNAYTLFSNRNKDNIKIFKEVIIISIIIVCLKQNVNIDNVLINKDLIGVSNEIIGKNILVTKNLIFFSNKR